MTDLLEQGEKYRSVCHHISIVSAFNDDIETKIIEEPPQVSSFIAGIINQKPPQPRYTFIWNVQLVIDYLKEYLSNNKKN